MVCYFPFSSHYSTLFLSSSRGRDVFSLDDKHLLRTFVKHLMHIFWALKYKSVMILRSGAKTYWLMTRNQLGLLEDPRRIGADGFLHLSGLKGRCSCLTNDQYISMFIFEFLLSMLSL